MAFLGTSKAGPKGRKENTGAAVFRAHPGHRCRAVPDMPSLTLFTQTTSRVVIIRPILQIRKPTWVKNTHWEDLRRVQRSAGVQTGGLVRQGEVRQDSFLVTMLTASLGTLTVTSQVRGIFCTGQSNMRPVLVFVSACRLCVCVRACYYNF